MQWHVILSFCRATICISAAYAVVRCLSVCLASVRHIRVLHQNLFSHLPVVIPVNFFRAKLYGNIPTGSPNGGVECRWI